jgi:hypothetical protein
MDKQSSLFCTTINENRIFLSPTPRQELPGKKDLFLMMTKESFTTLHQKLLSLLVVGNMYSVNADLILVKNNKKYILSLGRM